uniref:Uncharacterized protein n=1 Tax=Spironucleus salmonicida TaxID=348837 RepID=V6LF53_9EUKA|eukprot:EST43155.1 Hypothetical protein SS50377_17212 [Spironucleus salmonicida]
MVRVTLDSLKLSIHDDGISWQVGYYLLPITTTTGKSCIFCHLHCLQANQVNLYLTRVVHRADVLARLD